MSLQQLMRGVTIKFEVTDWTTKNFIAINSRYFNDNFNTNNIYVVAIKNLLLRIFMNLLQ